MLIPIKFVVPYAVSSIYCIYRIRKENKALAAGNRLLYSMLTTRTEQLKYLANLCEEHGIEVSEFDMIILTQEF